MEKTALDTITSNPNVPAKLRDPYVLFEMLESNLKFDDLKGKTVQLVAVWFNEETYLDNETGTEETGTRTYILTDESGTHNIYSGFSVTMRIKMQSLVGIFGDNLPAIKVDKVANRRDSMKQEYTIQTVKGAK